MLQCTLPPKVTGYADKMRADGIAYRVNPAIMLAIDKAPDGKIQGLQSIGNYARMQTMPRHKSQGIRGKTLDLQRL